VPGDDRQGDRRVAVLKALQCATVSQQLLLGGRAQQLAADAAQRLAGHTATVQLPQAALEMAQSLLRRTT